MHHTPVQFPDVRVPRIDPMRSLGLLSVAHAVNHAQAVVLPLIYLKVIDEFGVSVQTIAFLAAIGSFSSGHGPAELRGADPGRSRGGGCWAPAGSCSAAGSRPRRCPAGS